MDKKLIITVGRQTGSGGRLIAQKLAEELNIPYYSREILDEAARRSGVSKEIFERTDEKKHSSLLYSFAVNTYSFGVGGDELPLGTRMYLAQFEAIKGIAQQGSCVLVGRCADYFLRDEPGLVRIFITADYDDRLAHVMAEKGITEKAARDLLRKRDKERAAYYDFNTDNKWGMAANYDLCLNTTRVGIDGAVRLIRAFIDARVDAE